MGKREPPRPTVVLHSLLSALPLSLLLLAAGLGTACRTASPGPPPSSGGRGHSIERGIASWYGPGFAGRATASGEIFDPGELTAAHKTLPFGTLVRVLNLDNGREVTVRINDRGPFVRKRVIDLSRAAAEAIGMIGPGTARVELYAAGRSLVAEVVPARPGPFTIQVGAFQESWRAWQLRDELAAEYPRTEVASDAVWHRVRLGAFALRSEAEALARELAARGYEAVVVALSPGSPERP